LANNSIKTATFTAVNGEGYFVIQVVVLLQLIYQQVLLEQLFLLQITQNLANK
jgi:hypothetical protein